MGASLPALQLTEGRNELERLVRKRSAKAGLVMRARMILMAADGLSNATIARQLQCRAHVVGKWRRRFAAHGIDGLCDEARSGRPVEITEAVKQKIVMTACAKPRKGLSRWSVRTLARELGLPQARVQRVLREHDLHPHCLRTFTFSPDPEFKEKLLEVVALYMKPPENAVVLCVDEKTGVQALDRTQPVLPLRAKKPRSWTNEYVRHGTAGLRAKRSITTMRRKQPSSRLGCSFRQRQRAISGSPPAT
jgi:transposase